MPGKQMAIDADLNAGIIDQDEARARRAEVASEADFYGAMDGAGKFVRGDAIAGILILVINIAGGLAIGTLQHGLPFSEAVRNYSLLTIGDGLVAQIPSLVLSSAAAIMVTRVSTTQKLGAQILGQLFDNPQPLAVTGSHDRADRACTRDAQSHVSRSGRLGGGGAYVIHRRKHAEVRPRQPEVGSLRPRHPETSTGTMSHRSTCSGWRSGIGSYPSSTRHRTVS